jgi:hypothetical protein
MSKKTINIELSNSILRSFVSLIKVGNSLPSALNILIQVENGKSKKILERVYYNIIELDLTIGKSFEKEGLISSSEVFVIDNSTSGLESVESILSIRNFSGSFEKTILKLFAFPSIAVVIGLLIAYFAQPTFSDMITSLVEQVKVTKGIDVSGQSELMWYLKDRDSTKILLLIYVLFISSIISLYFYYLKYNPKIIYKLLPLKAYDDVPYILMLIYNLQKAGLDQVRVYKLLKESSPKIGWVKLFDGLEKEAVAGKMIYTVFEKYAFPRDVTIVLKSAEISRTFWDNMKALIAYVHDTNNSKHKTILSMFGGFSSVLGFMIILYFVSGLFMAMFSLQNLSMAMM